MKYIFLSLLLALASCVTTAWDGTLTQNGKAIKITIKEGGIPVTHFEVSLNGEYIGNAELVEQKMSKHSFSTLNTKFGVLKLIRNIRWNMAGDRIGFDCYLDDEFVGTVVTQ